MFSDMNCGSGMQWSGPFWCGHDVMGDSDRASSPLEECAPRLGVHLPDCQNGSVWWRRIPNPRCHALVDCHHDARIKCQRRSTSPG